MTPSRWYRTTTLGWRSAPLAVLACLISVSCQHPEPPKPVAAGRPPSVVPVAPMEAAVVARVNDIRAARGLPPLQPAADLGRVAREYSCRMAEQGFTTRTS